MPSHSQFFERAEEEIFGYGNAARCTIKNTGVTNHTERNMEGEPILVAIAGTISPRHLLCDRRWWSVSCTNPAAWQICPLAWKPSSEMRKPNTYLHLIIWQHMVYVACCSCKIPANIVISAKKYKYWINFLKSTKFNLFYDFPALTLPQITKQLHFRDIIFAFIFKRQQVPFPMQSNIFWVYLLSQVRFWSEENLLPLVKVWVVLQFLELLALPLDDNILSSSP